MRDLKATLWFTILIVSCNNMVTENKNKLIASTEVLSSVIQTVIDSANVEGSILIYDENSNKYFSNNFQKSREGYLPASTFKIPNSIIGLEVGILKDEQTVFKWNGNDRPLSIWEKDLTLKQAFQASCVPCYQELARKIGAKNMQENVDKLQFGAMDINEENVDRFWLVGDSKINPMNQINFLLRFYEEQLPISKPTYKTVKSIMKINKSNGYSLSGKTGLAVTDDKEVGWFVGYIEKGENVFYFATKIKRRGDTMNRSEFIRLRQEVTIEAFKKLKIIE